MSDLAATKAIEEVSSIATSTAEEEENYNPEGIATISTTIVASISVISVKEEKENDNPYNRIAVISTSAASSAVCCC